VRPEIISRKRADQGYFNINGAGVAQNAVNGRGRKLMPSVSPLRR
jgi:hypothetical protein